MKKNNGILNSDLKNLDMKKIFNGFNRWDTKYIYRVSLFRYVISIHFPWLKPRAMLKYDKLRFQEIAAKFVIARNEKSP